jgi:hypothetical protein
MYRLLDIIEAHLNAEQRGPRKSHWPSHAGAWTEDGIVGPCMLSEWWAWIGIEASNKPTLAGHFKMKIGNKCEDLIGEWAAVHAPMITQFEVAIEGYTRYPVHGFGDRLMFDPVLAGFAPIEIKSSYGRGIRQARKQGPKPEWKMQTTTYLVGLRKKWPKLPLVGLKYLLLGRDDGYLTELDYPINWETVAEDWGRIVYRWKALELYLKHGRRPRPEFRDLNDGRKKCKPPWSHWRCEYCAYLDKCKEECHERVEADDTVEV